MAAQLRRLGARAIIAPTIRIAPPSRWSRLDEALRRFERFDTLVFTSANGVTSFFRRSKALKRRLRRPRRLYAIGPRTAEALKAHGWRAAQVPERYEGEALARHLGNVAGREILIPRARVARDILPKILSRRGARVRVVEAYRTLPDAEGKRRLKRAVASGKTDVVTFTSSSTAEHFVSAVGRARARRFFRSALAASIGPITSKTLRRHGIRPQIEASEYTVQGLLSAILRHDGERR